MKKLIFKTNNKVAFLNVSGKTARIILNNLDLKRFDVKKVKMEGGEYRIKYTCLENDICFNLGTDMKIYLDKGFFIYEFI